MLKLAYSLGELNFQQLMEVYAQGNRENGAQQYPQLASGMQLLQAEQDFYAFLREFYRVKGAVYALWIVDGRYVSALRLEPYRDGLLLEALETAPDCRRQGYGKCLILATLEALCREKNVPVYSHVHKGNRASLGIHGACGFQKILNHAVYIDGSVTSRSVTLCWRGDR